MMASKNNNDKKELAALREAHATLQKRYQELFDKHQKALALLGATEYHALGLTVENIAIQLIEVGDRETLSAYADQEGYLGGRLLGGGRAQTFWVADAAPPIASLFGISDAALPDEMRYVIIPSGQRAVLTGRAQAGRGGT